MLCGRSCLGHLGWARPYFFLGGGEGGWRPIWAHGPGPPGGRDFSFLGLSGHRFQLIWLGQCFQTSCPGQRFQMIFPGYRFQTNCLGHWPLHRTSLSSKSSFSSSRTLHVLGERDLVVCGVDVARKYVDSDSYLAARPDSRQFLSSYSAKSMAEYPQYSDLLCGFMPSTWIY